MTNTETPKLSKWDRLMAFLDSLGSVDESEAETAETDAETAEVETDAETAEVEADAEVEVEVEADAETAEAEVDAEVTPGSAEPNEAADADLRAKLTEQAATIETYRNMLAGQGLDPNTAEAIIEAEADTPTEDERIAAFDEDYAVQEAKLAQIKMES